MNKNIKIILSIFFLLISYSKSFSQPQTEWVQRFNSPGNYNDYVTDMAIDKSGNIFLTGYVHVNDTDQNFVTIKYNTQGGEQWVRYYDGPDHREDKPVAIAVDDSGNVFVSGNSSLNFLTIKYNSLGDTIWSRRNKNGYGLSAMSLDKRGNVYTTGIAIGVNSEDIITVKYDNSGNLKWSRTYNGTADGFDIPFSLYIDNNSNIYISGQSRENRLSVPKGIIIKYSESGDEVWTVNPPKTFVNFTAVANDSDLVYSVGHSEPNNNTDISTLKLDSTGKILWERKYNRSDTVPDQDDFYRGFTLDEGSNAIFTCVNSDNVLRWDIATVKYNLNGDFQWSKIFGTANSNDESKSITNDKFGNVFVCGFKDDGLFSKYLTIKYSSSGEYLWNITYDNSFPFGSHKAYKILTDTIGNIYVTGVSQGNGTGNDISTLKYSQLTEVKYESKNISNRFNLSQNYPNPFNSQTIISFNIKTRSFVSIRVFNELGQEISSLVNDYKIEGRYDIPFFSYNFPSGIYFYSLSLNREIVETKKLIVIN